MRVFYQFFAVAALFFLLSPGVLVTLPSRGSKYFVALVHTLLFSLLVSVIYMLFWLPSLETLTDEPDMSCPEGQHWLSGTIQKYGYCSPSSIAQILTQPNVATPAPVEVPSPISYDDQHVCPGNQHWIAGTNPHYGYCSPATMSNVLQQQQDSDVSFTQATSCPPDQYLVSGTNKKYSYCSPTSVSNLLTRPSVFDINPVEVNGLPRYW